MSEGRRRGRPPGEFSEDTAQRILDTARVLFAEHGFTVTTNRMVADAAGVTPTALYHYHPSKLDLYVAVHRDCREQLMRRMQAAVESHATFATKLAGVLDQMQVLAEDNAVLARFLSSARVDMIRRADVAEALREGSQWWAELLGDVVETGVAMGELRPEERAGATALLAALMLGITDAASIDVEVYAKAVTAARKALLGWAGFRGLGGD